MEKRLSLLRINRTVFKNLFAAATKKKAEVAENLAENSIRGGRRAAKAAEEEGGAIKIEVDWGLSCRAPDKGRIITSDLDKLKRVEITEENKQKQEKEQQNALQPLCWPGQQAAKPAEESEQKAKEGPAKQKGKQR